MQERIARQSQVTDIRKAAGLVREKKAPRQPRAEKQGREPPIRWPSMSPLAAALSQSGVKAEAELAKAHEVERELRWRIHELEAALHEVTADRDRLLSLRVVRWWLALKRHVERGKGRR